MANIPSDEPSSYDRRPHHHGTMCFTDGCDEDEMGKKEEDGRFFSIFHREIDHHLDQAEGRLGRSYLSPSMKADFIVTSEQIDSDVSSMGDCEGDQDDEDETLFLCIPSSNTGVHHEEGQKNQQQRDLMTPLFMENYKSFHLTPKKLPYKCAYSSAAVLNHDGEDDTYSLPSISFGPTFCTNDSIFSCSATKKASKKRKSRSL
jgi:hypothetical protein